MNEPTATRYQRLRRRAEAASLASGGLIVAVLALSPAARVLARWADAVGGGLPPAAHAAVTVLVFVGIVVLLWELAVLPAALYAALGVDARFRRQPGNADEVILAQAQAALVALVVAWAAGVVVLVSVAAAGGWWWGMAGLAAAGALALAVRFTPALLPLLGDARAVARPGLAAGLRHLADRARVPVAAIQEWRVDDGRVTALVAGLGRSRRVFIASSMLRHWTDDEIAVVVAHELSHHVHHDLWRTLALDAAVLAAGCWAADRVVAGAGAMLGVGGAGDVAALPLIGLVAGLVWVLAAPVRHAQSRAHELRADRFALALTDSADAFSAAIRRLGAHRLVEERPSALTRWLFHRHPSVDERLRLAREHRRVSAGAS